MILKIISSSAGGDMPLHLAKTLLMSIPALTETAAKVRHARLTSIRFISAPIAPSFNLNVSSQPYLLIQCQLQCKSLPRRYFRFLRVFMLLGVLHLMVLIHLAALETLLQSKSRVTVGISSLLREYSTPSAVRKRAIESWSAQTAAVRTLSIDLLVLSTYVTVKYRTKCASRTTDFHVASIISIRTAMDQCTRLKDRVSFRRSFLLR